MSYYDHISMITHQLGPWSPQPQPPFDIPAASKKKQAEPDHRPINAKPSLKTRKPSILIRLFSTFLRKKSATTPHEPATPTC